MVGSRQALEEGCQRALVAELPSVPAAECQQVLVGAYLLAQAGGSQLVQVVDYLRVPEAAFQLAQEADCQPAPAAACLLVRVAVCRQDRHLAICLFHLGMCLSKNLRGWGCIVTPIKFDAVVLMPSTCSTRQSNSFRPAVSTGRPFRVAVYCWRYK